ncbi:MAG: CAP domain-containing protein [Solirubrobacteraceae bacterium]
MPRTDALRTSLLAALLLLLILPAHSAAAGAADCPHADDLLGALSTADQSAALLCAVDAERTARALPAVRENPELSLAAQSHALDMVARQFFDHVTPGGSTPEERVQATGYMDGYADWALGEVLAWEQAPLDTVANVMQAWLDSPTHRAVILDGRFREVGTGVVLALPDGSGLTGATAVLEFGVRQTSPTPGRWQSATWCARAAQRSRKRPARCASTSKRSRSSKSSRRARHSSSTRSVTT